MYSYKYAWYYSTLFEYLVNASDFTNSGEIPKPTATRILANLRDNDQIITLREASGRRPAVYAFAELINIAEGDS